VIHNPQLAELATQLEAVRRHAVETTRGLSEAQLNWQPASGSWGVAQCLEHLVLTMEGNEEQVPGKLAAAVRPSPPNYNRWKSGWIGRMIINGTRPGSRPVRTRARFVPVTVRPDVVRRFNEKHDLLMDWMRAADGLDVTRITIVSPFLSIFRYHLGDFFELNVVHGERHLRQADRVKERPGFPKA
jgi:hypothetical protein